MVMGTLTRSELRPAVPAQEHVAGPGQQYLTFMVADEMFALPIAAIREIVEYREPTDVPMMPSFIRGVINLRGRVVPVIDLCARFSRGKGQTSRRSCFVILELNHQEWNHDIGVLVDAVSAVLEIADADIEPPPNFGIRLRSDFISGMGKVGERFVIILNIDKVLSVDELSSLGGLDNTAGLPAVVSQLDQSTAAEVEGPQ
jgi:purine-binding chemotaxis protein CheW